MSLTTVIVSHKRAERVLTAKWLPWAQICVPESQVPAYREHNPEMAILPHPDNVLGLGAKRQWIIENHAPVFMVDDDVLKVLWMMREKIERLAPEEVYAVIQNGHEMALELGVKVWGFPEAGPPISFHPTEPFRLNAFIHGGVMGIEADHGLYVHPKIRHYDDLWLCALNAHKHRLNFSDRRVAFQLAKPERNTGGNADNRLQTAMRDDAVIMRETFGHEVIRRRNERTVPNKMGKGGKIYRRSDDHIDLKLPI